MHPLALLLTALGACLYPGELPSDKKSDDSDSPDSAVRDSDGPREDLDETGDDEALFSPDSVSFTLRTAWNGASLSTAYTDLYDPSTAQEPRFTLTLVDESGSWQAPISCTWSARASLAGEGPSVTGSLDSWALSLSTQDSSCAGFDPAAWGDSDPRSKLESTSFGLAFGVVTREAQPAYVESLEQVTGRSFEELGATVLAVWSSVNGSAPSPTHYATALSLDSSGVPITGSDGTLQRVDFSGAAALPSPIALQVLPVESLDPSLITDPTF